MNCVHRILSGVHLFFPSLRRKHNKEEYNDKKPATYGTGNLGRYELSNKRYGTAS
ncbi:hypothetical protein THOG05_310001 [Vibrio rotiferianus]|nr:hypothetical protein THOG05_310001 [Vibrio rotiferianus]CAH1570606.1 hypothetical protein THOG10_20132 [Vibrio rotiferianus]CAH1572686.1 hypothetical protein THOB06_20132 [Vibrio rotiferianus]CAH1580733.1 hypothetical protein THOE12_60148 [Vibrio rotiferianus]